MSRSSQSHARWKFWPKSPLGHRYKGRHVQLRCDCMRCHDAPDKRKNRHASKQVRAAEKAELRKELK